MYSFTFFFFLTGIDTVAKFQECLSMLRSIVLQATGLATPPVGDSPAVLSLSPLSSGAGGDAPSPAGSMTTPPSQGTRVGSATPTSSTPEERSRVQRSQKRGETPGTDSRLSSGFGSLPDEELFVSETGSGRLEHGRHPAPVPALTPPQSHRQRQQLEKKPSQKHPRQVRKSRRKQQTFGPSSVPVSPHQQPVFSTATTPSDTASTMPAPQYTPRAQDASYSPLHTSAEHTSPLSSHALPDQYYIGASATPLTPPASHDRSNMYAGQVDQVIDPSHPSMDRAGAFTEHPYHYANRTDQYTNQYTNRSDQYANQTNQYTNRSDQYTNRTDQYANWTDQHADRSDKYASHVTGAVVSPLEAKARRALHQRQAELEVSEREQRRLSSNVKQLGLRVQEERIR